MKGRGSHRRALSSGGTGSVQTLKESSGKLGDGLKRVRLEPRKQKKRLGTGAMKIGSRSRGRSRS